MLVRQGWTLTSKLNVATEDLSMIVKAVYFFSESAQHIIHQL